MRVTWEIMTVLRIRVPERDEVREIALGAGEAVIVGRDPTSKRLDQRITELLSGLRLREVQIASKRVSANHLLAWSDGTLLRVWDLLSKNGSWMRVVPRVPIALPATSEVELELASTAHSPPRFTDPKDAQWDHERDYATAVHRAVVDWFTQLGVTVQAWLGTGARPEDDAESMALADGSVLFIAPPRDSTFELPWTVVTERVRTYVNDQNVRYDLLQGHDDDFVLASPGMRIAHRELADAAAYGMRVMILGPTGAGKDRLARCYHKHSRQHRGPYATVNCALLHENLLYAQLFGARKGSFTGAVSDVAGLVEAANEGTLFLDEVGELDLEVQKALLRFLDSRGEYYRLGDTQARRANVQVVCATNVALDNPSVRHGRFRDDLWYRLAVKVVRVPPLRERKEDILGFLRTHYLRGGQVRALDALSKPALEIVMADSWPGNFRDLENFIERLPPNPGLGGISEQICEAALREGRGATDPAQSRTQRLAGASAEFGALTPGDDWAAIETTAFSAFESDHGSPPANWSQLHTYMEKYLKPVFIANSTKLTEISELSKSINYSELARRLNIADGTTVKMHLGRYIDRFRKKAAPQG